MLLSTPVSRIAGGLLDSLRYILTTLYIFIWDFGLTFASLFLPNKPEKSLIAPGKPGHGGIWPVYQAPSDSYSRGPCPGLNTLANHGILPRDGRNIRFTEIARAIHETYNFSQTWSMHVTWFAAQVFGRSYGSDTMDLSDLCAHNGLEHDASLTRHDTFHAPDQSKPALDLIDRLLASASGPKGTLTAADISRFTELRRAECKATNGQYTQSTTGLILGSSNAATLVTAFGGDVQNLRVWLKEERLPEGYEPANRWPLGMTITGFYPLLLGIELGIRDLAPRTKSDEKGIELGTTKAKVL